MRAPTNVHFPCCQALKDSPRKVPQKVTQSVHGSAHEDVHWSGQFSHVLFSHALLPCPNSSAIAAIIITKNTLKIYFGTLNFVKITKQSLYKANSFACSLANRDKPVAATLQRKCSGGTLFLYKLQRLLQK